MDNNLKIAHLHVWDKLNKGDLAIVLAVQAQLKEIFPQSRIMDWPMETLKNASKTELAKINAQDILLIGGGGIFYRYFLPFDKKIIKAINIPIVIYGAGYIREVGSRPLNQTEKDSLRDLISRAALIGVRDNYTKDFLSRLTGAGKRIAVVGDPAIFLPEKKIIDWPAGQTFKIGLNINYSGWLGFGRWQEKILQSYRQTAEFFQTSQGAKIYYLKHHPGEDRIIPALGIAGLEIVDRPPSEQKYFYRQLDLVIGMMLHVSVLSFGAGTPEINLAYDLRNRSFARFIGCPELCLRLEELSGGGLLRLAKIIVKKSDFYRRKFTRRIKELKKRQGDFLGQIRRSI